MYYSTIKADFNKPIGKMKPMHAVSNGPNMGFESTRMFSYMKEAGIPYTRLHDTGGTYSELFVDIPRIFRDFSKDPSDPANYDFAFTDWLLERFTENDVKPFYRLGVSIEHGRYIKPMHIDPPEDFDKWAKICEGVIRHYNEGWANGYHYDIKYWEIWCEPDIRDNPKDSQFWRGTKQQFFEFYETASKHLKKCFPDIKIGGFGAIGFYAKCDSEAPAHSAAPVRAEYQLQYIYDFLKYARDNSCPLDFFTWHSYDTMDNTARSAYYAREALDEYGFTECENILGEWNPGPMRRGTLADAACCAKMMADCHNAPLDMMVYYQATIHGGHSGLFNPMTYKPFPTFYVFKTFNELYKLGTAVEIEADIPAVAATDGKIGRIMVSNINIDDCQMMIEVPSNWKFKKSYMLQDACDLTEYDSLVRIPYNSMGMVEYEIVE